MTKHPNRSRGPYTAEIFGPSWKQGPIVEFSMIRDARKWAEEFGTTADRCVIRDKGGKRVAEHRRDTSGRGDRWFLTEASE